MPIYVPAAWLNRRCLRRIQPIRRGVFTNACVTKSAALCRRERGGIKDADLGGNKTFRPEFVRTLGSILGVQDNRAFDIISRKGRVLTAQQVKSLLAWLNNSKQIRRRGPTQATIVQFRTLRRRTLALPPLDP